MKRGGRKKLGFSVARWRTRALVACVLALALAGGGCFSEDEGELYYGRVVTPRSQEFRWSDGGLPQVFDPALVAAPPDTDAVRALYEGLTEYDPQTLKPVAAVADRWESSADNRAWTFHLRRDARWSNGDPVTAHDFARSWRRTLRFGERAPHARLLANIEGAEAEAANKPAPPTEAPAPREAGQGNARPTPSALPAQTATPVPPPPLGVEVAGDYTLTVRLQRPDKNFPALVAHPVFRPVHASVREEPEAGGEVEGEAARAPRSEQTVVSNGAFSLRESARDGVVLERAKSYWNAKTVALERVRFVAAPDAESALAAYRAGEVDAVTNANIEPLALKLLAPYKDFRRNAFGALTFYDVNSTRAPFNDLRVRRALSLAIDRRRLSADTLGGATEPAEGFLPGAYAEDDGGAAKRRDGGRHAPSEKVEGGRETASWFDPALARALLAEAGFPGGGGLPRVRLLINRNEQHRQVAMAVAAMWREALGVETQIIMLNWDEYEASLRAGEWDVPRRSVVMQTPDEESNLLAMFDTERFNFSRQGEAAQGQGTPPASDATAGGGPRAEDAVAPPPAKLAPVLTQAQAVRELPAIPIYFATSYALVKPYVAGFDANTLDAPSLQRVRINTDWQMPKRDSFALRSE